MEPATTPEFFVLNRDRQVVYMGAMDDSPDGEEVHEQYVEKAVEAALKGASPEVTKRSRSGVVSGLSVRDGHVGRRGREIELANGLQRVEW